MGRLLTVLVIVVLMESAGPVSAGQRLVPPTVQLPPQTMEQVIKDCTISGLLFASAAGLGVLKPVTVALHTMTTFALLHEAIYGCGLGVIGGYVSQSLLSLIPIPPPGNPFDLQTSATLPDGTVHR
ncbi:MAG: hypothetical protein WCK65_12550 [Rhodospirillaceae bacterium]